MYDQVILPAALQRSFNFLPLAILRDLGNQKKRLAILLMVLPSSCLTAMAGGGYITWRFYGRWAEYAGGRMEQSLVHGWATCWLWAAAGLRTTCCPASSSPPSDSQLVPARPLLFFFFPAERCINSAPKNRRHAPENPRLGITFTDVMQQDHHS